MSIRGTRAGTGPRAAVRPVEPLPDVLGPDLPGAACKGHGGLFDDWREHWAPSGRFRPETSTERAERHDAAMQICWGCPVRTDCLTARYDEPKLGPGVWGGVLFERGATPTTPQPTACHCGTPLPQDAHPTRVHCSSVCRQHAYAARGEMPVRACLYCDALFTPVHGNERHCSPRHKQQYAWRLQGERRKEANRIRKLGIAS